MLKAGDKVKLIKVVGDDISLLQDIQTVESVYDIPQNGEISFYGVELLNCPYLLTNKDVELVNEKQKNITLESKNQIKLKENY